MENAWFTNLQPMDDRHTKRQQGIILGTGKPPTPHELEKLFDKKTIKVVYRRQTEKAKDQGVSNCPLCAIGYDANAKRIYKETEMDADHVTAWSKGGVTDENNCQMLCKTHNRAKGNK